jgi:hypothetical protein
MLAIEASERGIAGTHMVFSTMDSSTGNPSSQRVMYCIIAGKTPTRINPV